MTLQYLKFSDKVETLRTNSSNKLLKFWKSKTPGNLEEYKQATKTFYGALYKELEEMVKTHRNIV